MQLPNLKIESRLISKYVLLPGDPARVDLIGKRLKEFKIIGQNREFRIGQGYYKNILITVCSTGIGCPSTAIAVEELIKAGAKVLIRVGTCGGAWRLEIREGSLIIPTASIRDEGTTLEYIDKSFPAVADFNVVSALVESAKKRKQRFFVGINRTHDAFYGSFESIVKWGKYLLDNNWKNNDTPILSSEMESSALFVIASLRNVQAGVILAVNSGPESLLERLKNRKKKVITELDANLTRKTVEKMIDVALDAILILSK